MNHKTGLVLIIVCSVMILMCMGCAGQGANPLRFVNKGSTPPKSSPEVRSAYLVVPLCTLGVAASLFALFLGGGYTKLGLAGMGTSVLTSAYAIAQAKFAWMFALAGLGLGLLCLLNAWIKNRKIIHGAIDGIEDIKDTFFPKTGIGDGTRRSQINEMLQAKLPREASAIVAARKLAVKEAKTL